MAQGLASRTPLTDTATPSQSLLERCTKPFLFLSLTAAIWSAAWGLAVSVPIVRWLVPASFAAAWIAARYAPAIVRQALLGACYLVPAIFQLLVIVVPAGAWVVWMAPLCGLLLATMPLRRWALPPAVRIPLAFWALVAAMTWPLVVLREANFVWARIHPGTASWVGGTAAATILGILWLESLCAAFSRLEPAAGEPSFERQVAIPMAAGWVVAAIVGLYQMFVDVTFLNRGVWGALHRAIGTLSDANPFGVLSAMWGPVVFAIAIERWSGWRRVAGAAALPLSWLAIWASGSRSSLPIAALALVLFVGWYVGANKAQRGIRLARVAAALVLLAAAAGIAARLSVVQSPLARATVYFAPTWSFEWASTVVSRLQSRDGYGTVAAALIRDFPSVGLGIGSFHGMVPTYAWKLSRSILPPDNAQNWYRHHLAELGIAGSLGWILWVAWFLWVLAFGRSDAARPLTAAVLRAVLAGFGLISLVGMPGQDVAVVFTFWTMAFWFLALLEPGSKVALQRWLVTPTWWVVVWMLALGYTAATAYVGRTAMSLPRRSAAADLDYSYGFYAPEADGSFRWAAKEAVVVIPAPAGRRWLAVTVWVQHIDVAKNPVDVKVWTNRELIVQTRLSSIEPVTRYVRVPDGDKRVILETWVSRTLRPRDFGVPDDRELGLLVGWKFLEAAPPSAVP
jgi:hypothetical protein